ncbi:MAG: UDP-N-acetylglucosamine--N-acetylmuramyl-(pentapeptide) pyrophosphoryl-undecaprenol N-acetylglucosamine transferase [Candidatus Dormibacteria bacterium]
MISGGGTGGHIYPALAVASALTELAPGTEILYLGRGGGMEEGIVPAAGFELEGIPMRGVQPRLIQNLPLAYQLPLSVGRAVGLMRRFRPEVVFGTGGYVVAAVGVAALLTRRPLLLQLPDAVPGRAIRVLGPRARTVYTAFAASEARLRGSHCVLSGTPLRAEVVEVARARASRTGPLRRILVFGGSQGANRLNVALAEAMKELLQLPGVSVAHVSGAADHEWLRGFRAGLPDATRERYELMEYHPRLYELYLDADLVVGRSGGSAVAEMTVVGIPAILVPYPFAGGHQLENARPVVAAGGAVLVPDGELSGNRLLSEVRRLAGQEGAARLQAMGAASRAMGRPGAAEVVARGILSAA